MFMFDQVCGRWEVGGKDESKPKWFYCKDARGANQMHCRPKAYAVATTKAKKYRAVYT